MDAFPAFFPLKGRRIVIAGEGLPAEAKAALFRESPAEVVLLDQTAGLDPGGYAGADLVFVASYDADFAAAAARIARAAGPAPLNVVDHPELSDFHTPAIIDRGQVVAAVGTTGAAPVVAALLRAELEARISPGAGPLVRLLGERREALRRAFPDLPIRRAFLRGILAGPVSVAAEAGDLPRAAALLDRAIGDGWLAVGQISFLVVPAAPDLLSLRAARALNVADIVVAGADAQALIDAHARRDAEHWTRQAATVDALFAQTGAGRLIVLVDETIPEVLAAGLEARGVSVQRLEPASAP
jgi:precorrin-2 dehydrogenase/sirohydrochlorin ferrochelatase